MAFALSACALLSLAGCYGSVETLDREVAKMIAQRQRLSLGEQGVSAAEVAAPSQSDADIDAYTPPTFNPAAEALPARATRPEASGRSVTPADALPALDSAEPVVFDLPQLLGYAIEFAPEYRSEKERLFLA
ncbi:MAG: hypothetical protein ACPGYV_06785, partial [Phycisphaeraceae bacterium]